MHDPTTAIPADEFLGVERESPVAGGLSPDEAALIERCLSGDDTAFDQIILRYQDMVFNLSVRLLGGHDEAVDLSQEVFFQVYRKLSSFRQDASLRTWIYRIVINRAKNRQRWWRRRFLEMTAVPLEDVERKPYWELSAPINGGANAPDQVLERKELGQILHRAIDELPFEQKSALLLKDIEGLSYDEIAETLRIPLGTVKSRLARARSTLRDRLDPSLFGLSEED